MSKQNADYLMASAQAAGIVDHVELSNFMGQMQVESAGFSRMSENLNYSGRRLLEVFKGRNGLHTLVEANEIAAQGAEAIANAIYGGRWGERNLGNTEPGDGWAYRGRGYVQLTGRANYERLGNEIGLDLVGRPELVEERETAARVAIHYWQSRVVANGHQLDVAAATRSINGGQNHLAERIAYAAEWKQKLDSGYRPDVIIENRPYDFLRDLRETVGHLAQGTIPPIAHTNGMPDYLLAYPTTPPAAHAATELREGTRGEGVRELQQVLEKLNIRDGEGRTLVLDGVFGPSTREAVENFQLWHGLPTSGVADRGTLAALRDPRPALATARPGDAADPAAGRAAAAGPGDPAHPDHAMYQRIRAGVRAIDDGGGKTYDETSERVCRALLAQCKDPGGSSERPVRASPAGAALRRVDHVVMGSTGNLFAVEGRLDDPAHKRVCVAVAQVAHVDVEASDRRLSEANARIAQELDAARQHAHARHPTGPDPGAPVGMG